MTANEVVLAYSFGVRDFSEEDLRGADLSWADLSGADLSWANLRWANLRGANLRGAKLPSPTIFLLAEWGEVSDSLCAALMRYDASNHDDPGKFIAWKYGGNCPYNGESYQRSANFKEKKELFSMDAPLLSARQLMQCLLLEKCKYYEGETDYV